MLSGVFHPGWPMRDFLHCARHNFVYCPIPKVACSSLKQWFRALEGLSEVDVQPDIHGALRDRFSLGRYSRRRAEELLRSDALKVVFVRDPWDRLASAFSNKFVGGRKPAIRALLRRRRLARQGERQGLFTDMLDRLGAALPSRSGDLERELEQTSFRDFVAYLGADDPREFDKHWRPQHMFFDPWQFDYVGRFETLTEDFAALCRKLSVEARLPHRNKTTYAKVDARPQCYADYTVADLRRLPALPASHQFYDSGLVAAVSAIYVEDIVRFGYRFEGVQARRAA